MNSAGPTANPRACRDRAACLEVARDKTEASSPLYPPSSKYALPASELEAGLQPMDKTT